MIPIYIAGVPPGVNIGIFDESLAKGEPGREIVLQKVPGPGHDFVTEIDDSYSNTRVKLVVRSAGFLPKSFDTEISEIGLFRAVEMQPDQIYSGDGNVHAGGWNSSLEYEGAQERLHQALLERHLEYLREPYAADSRTNPEGTATITDELGTRPAPGPSLPPFEPPGSREVGVPQGDLELEAHAPTIEVTDKVKLGRSIIQRRSEILEQAPAVQEAAKTILASYDQNLPNDPETQTFVSNLRELSDGIDGFVTALNASPTDEKVGDASTGLLDKLIASVEALEKTKTGDRALSIGACALLMSVAALFAPTILPEFSLALMTACVFHKEAPKASKLLKGIGKMIRNMRGGDC